MTLVGYIPFNLRGSVGSVARDINSSGDIVGFVGSGTDSQGFLAQIRSYSSIHFTLIDVPAALSTEAEGINDRGVIVGAFTNAQNQTEGFIRDQGGAFQTLSVPGSLSTDARGINDLGQVVGVYSPLGSSFDQGFLYSDGAFTTIKAPGALSTEVNGINDLGEISGSYEDRAGVEHGFVEYKGAFTTIDVPGATDTWVFGLNDHSDVAGYYTDGAGQTHGFVGENVGEGGFAIVPQPPLDIPGATFTAVYGVNQKMSVVGDYDDSMGGGAFQVTVQSGIATEGVGGGSGNDILQGTSGNDVYYGGAGDDTFKITQNSLELSQGGVEGKETTQAVILDFQGAGGWSTTSNDFLSLDGFGAGSTLTFSHYGDFHSGKTDGGPDVTQQYYTIHSASTDSDYTIWIRSLDGSHLGPGDYQFYG